MPNPLDPPQPPPLRITGDPNALDPSARPASPDWGAAATSTYSALSDWLAQQRQKSVDMGLLDPSTGWPTQAGWGQAAMSYPNALVMGTSGPEGGGVRAFHGSPYSFDRFDASKIGTGEGAQAFGHGLYFAENEGVARSYKDIPPSGTPSAQNIAQRLLGKTNFSGDVMDEDAVAQSIRRVMPNIGDDEIASAIASAKSKPPGHMYEVNLNADPEHFLDWDKPLSEQSQHVQDTLHTMGMLPDATAESTAGHFGYSLDEFRSLPQERQQALIQQTPPSAAAYRSNPTGSDIWQNVVNQHGLLREGAAVPAATSLQSAGIPGIRYLDQGSRGAGQGTSNYVMFNPDTIDILRKYGIAGLIGGTAAAGAATSGNGQQQ